MHEKFNPETDWKLGLVRQMRCAGCGDVLSRFTLRELRAEFVGHLAQKHPSR